MIIRRRQTLDDYRANQHLAQQSSPRVPTLWITGQSELLQERLLKTVGLRSATIVRPVADGDGLSPHTLNLIADAIVNRKVRCVIVCGETSDVPWPCSESSSSAGAATADQSDSLPERMRNYLRCRRLAQLRIERQLRQLHAHAGVASALRRQSTSLFGMFYLPENDAFLIFDQHDQQFVSVFEALS